MTRDLERELAEETGEWPEAWKPGEGETLIATVKRYSTGQSAYGPVRTVIVERADGSRVSLWLSSVVILSLFERDKPRVGERIGLKYCGKHPQKGYRRYALKVDRPEQEPDFSPLGGEQDAEPAPIQRSEAPLDVRTPPPPGPRTTDRSATPYAAATIRKPRPVNTHSQAPDFSPPPDGEDPFAD